MLPNNAEIEAKSQNSQIQAISNLQNIEPALNEKKIVEQENRTLSVTNQTPISLKIETNE